MARRVRDSAPRSVLLSRGGRAGDPRRGPPFLMLAGVFPVIPYVAVGQRIALDLIGLHMYTVELAVMPVAGPMTSDALSIGGIAEAVDAFHLLAAIVIAADLVCRWLRGSPERGRTTACSVLALLVVGLSHGGVRDARADWDARQRRAVDAPVLIEEAHRALERGDEREAASLLEQGLRDDFSQVPERLRLAWLLLTSEDPAVRDVERAVWHYGTFERARIYHDGRSIPTEFEHLMYRALRAVWVERAGDRGEALDQACMADRWSREDFPELEPAVEEVVRRELLHGDTADWSELVDRLMGD